MFQKTRIWIWVLISHIRELFYTPEFMENTMQIKFYGTRGSIPVSSPNTLEYGGNTTCVRISSDCLPPGLVISIDAGSGFVPLSWDALSEKTLKEFLILFTHYHYDHTQGLFLSPVLFKKDLDLKLCGPVDQNIGPKQMLHELMRPPYFPVHHRLVESHITYQNFEFPQTMVIIFHPEGGYNITTIEAYERIINKNNPIPINQGQYPLEECMVITMHKSKHPEQTVSYRIEEKPTGKSFIFLTDHENEDGIPLSFRQHLANADLLVMDSQYSREKYDTFTAGYGHGTPDYCVKVAQQVGAKKLGLTHHDPTSSDQDVKKILLEAENHKTDNNLEIFACSDYLTVNL